MKDNGTQSLPRKSMKKKIGGMCISILMFTLPIFSLQMDLDLHIGDTNLKHSIVFKTFGGKGE